MSDCEKAMKNSHMNLWFPQWQGGGQDLSTHSGGIVIKEHYLTGMKLEEVEVATEKIRAVKNDIFGYDEIYTQLESAKKLIEAYQPKTIFTVGGGCDADIPSASYLNGLLDGKMTLLYFDSHGDLNTPESSGSKHFYGMPLRALLGEGDKGILELICLHFKNRQVITLGMRDLDKAEAEYIADSKLKGFRVDEIEENADAVIAAVRLIGYRDIYIHIDLDVLDPEEFPDVPVPVKGGMKNESLLKLLKKLSDEFRIIGLGLFEYGANENKNDKMIKEIVKIGVGL